jgi:hypothetical protein
MPLVVKAPEPLQKAPGTIAVFLAGSIEMGSAVPWQDHLEASLSGVAVTLWNPRRVDWDASWRQSIDDPRFREQVEWELSAQEQADLIVMYLAPGTTSPITLLELGLFARSGRIVVCCPEGYWRRGNVQVVCRRYGVREVADLGGLVEAVRAAVGGVSGG